MKYITTILCAIAFAFSGAMLALSDDNSTIRKHSTVSAAVVPNYGFPTTPLINQFATDKKYTKPDTVYLDTYTAVLPPRPIKTVTKVKPIYLPAPTQEDTESCTVDKFHTDSVKNKVGVVREEYTTDTIGPPDKSIILIVDGKEVYKRQSLRSWGIGRHCSLSPEQCILFRRTAGQCISGGSHQPGHEIVQLDPRICQPAQQVRNAKGRMKCYKDCDVLRNLKTLQ